MIGCDATIKDRNAKSRFGELDFFGSAQPKLENLMNQSGAVKLMTSVELERSGFVRCQKNLNRNRITGS